MISEIQAGNIPPPDPPVVGGNVPPESPALTLTPKKHSDGKHKVNTVVLKERLLEGCTRLGDQTKYGSKGLNGLWREGVKWATRMMLDGHLPADGRA